jgi:uncharacterized protein YdbL (DUF1318 family)
MSEEWDSDIASLLDDVLNDVEPEVAAQETAPDTPEPPQEQEALSSDDNLVEVDGELHDAGDINQDPGVEQVVDAAGKLAEMIGEEDDPTWSGTSDGGIGDSVPTACEEVTTVVKPSTISADGDTLEEDIAKDAALAALPPIDMSQFATPVENETVALPQFTTDELMESIDVRNFGTLVSLTNRRWHAKIKDRKAAKDAADATGAVSESFEARKRLLVGADEKLKAVHKCIDAARTDHYRMTLPWSTVGVNDIGKRAGPRLLPNSLLFDYSQIMGQHKAQMIDALDTFVTAYPTLIAIAQQKLQGSFNQTDYPAPETINHYFTLEFDFEPIPSGGDFQGLQDAQARKLAEALNKKTRKRLENAMGDAWQRLYETVERAVNALTNPDALFHYTLVDALREHSATLKHLNVINDARIEEVRAGVEKELTMHDAKDVRKDDALRKRLGEAATKIRDKMQEYAA